MSLVNQMVRFSEYFKFVFLEEVEMLPWAPEDGSLALMTDKRRLELEERADCRFVGRDEFIRLLTSSRNLVRADEGPIGLRGLLDIDTNDTFYIEEAELDGGESVTPWF